MTCNAPIVAAFVAPNALAKATIQDLQIMVRQVALHLTACLPLFLIASCNDESSQYTLYRNSVLDAKMRVHVASFDSSDGDAYNAENCEIAAGLFVAQPGVQVRYWCEKGRFRK
ncbi:hypothetical protein [Rhizobium leguminosarum]|uniref:hypothetical protein n=1 Tax=Rhizobium TaxID=379 RepID=UPI001C93CE2C|nr:hypothetical protein [Rhizobium leguminosarum]MBY5388489.1 hypothetical protein [Rhizobium leguminosarum]